MCNACSRLLALSSHIHNFPASYDGKWYNNEIGNGIATALGIPIEYVGAAPIELIGSEEEVREMMESFHETSIAAGYI